MGLPTNEWMTDERLEDTPYIRLHTRIDDGLR